MKILLVEDDILLAHSLSIALKHMNYEIDCKHTGADTEKALLEKKYDLLILDLGLPDKSGFEVLAAIKNKNDQTPVLILTGQDTPEQQQRGLELGADDFMAKPFQLHELQNRIRVLAQPHHLKKADLWQLGPLSFDQMERIAYLNQEQLDLKPHELGVLEILLRRSGRLVSTEQVYNHLNDWGNDLNHEMIDECIVNLRIKMNGKGINISSVPNLGYCLQNDPR